MASLRVLRQAVASSSRFSRAVHTEAKLASMGITLPKVVPPKGNYVPCVRMGNTIFTAGHIPQKENGELVKGKVGKTMDQKEAYDVARLIAINIIATLKNELGDLDKVKRITKVVGFVNCTDDFTMQPAVINGASDLFAEVFGGRGVHARSAVGTNALPLGIPVEVECVVEVEP